MMIGLIVAIVFSTVVAMVLSASEASLARISRVRAAELVDENRRGSATLARVLADSGPYIAVATFMRVAAEATSAVLVTILTTRLVDGFWATLGISIGIMILISFVLVGVSPRTLGRQHADRVALWAAPLVRGLRIILGPLARLLVLFGNMVTPGRGYRDGPFDSEAELRDLVDLAGESSLIEADEREMIHSIFELGDTVAREVMVPRTDMVTIHKDKALHAALNLFNRSGFSRVPVVGEDSDDMIGVLYFKDVVRRTHTDGGALNGTTVGDLARPAQFVPESKLVHELLKEMQRQQNHFAVVVDEYGGTAGLLTIEDILEEIVGEITDEYDRDSPDLTWLDEYRLRVDAGVDIDDLAELFDVEIEEEDVDSVGGLLTKAIGRVPIVGSECEVAGLRLTAERMAGRRHRVATVIVERVDGQPLPPQPESGETDRHPSPGGSHVADLPAADLPADDASRVIAH